MAAAHQLQARLDAEWRSLRTGGIKIEHFGPAAGGGPFVIGVVDADKHRAALETRYGTFGEDTVRIVESDVQLLSRQDDVPPYYGGAWIKRAGLTNVATQGCSSGFGAFSYGNGARYIITAYHCMNPNDRRFWDGGDDRMGSATAWNREFDAAFIRVNSLPFAWDGPWNSASQTKRIARMTAPRAGVSLCTSGAFSGIRCDGR